MHTHCVRNAEKQIPNNKHIGFIVICYLVFAISSLTLAGCESGGAWMRSGDGIVARAQDADPTRIEVTEQTQAKRRFIDRLRFWENMSIFESEPPAVEGETLIFGSDGPTVQQTPQEGSIQGELAGAHELFRQKEYHKAEGLFRRLADAARYPPHVVEEARFHEAECLRLQRYYPQAADTYVDVLKKFPTSVYREQCLQHMYDIANYWLDDTRVEMEEHKEKLKGDRWVVWPRFVSLDKTKPMVDREGRALEKLEQVRYNDINGPLADKALFLIGSVKFFNENYRDADYYFSQIYEYHPKSEMAPKAIELAIISKHLSTGGSDYDGRKTAEARKLVQAALHQYPELAKKQDFLTNQLAYINLQQAEKDFKMAQFYESEDKPASAYFIYEIVRRRYPGTRYAQDAEIKVQELLALAQKRGIAIVQPSDAPGQHPAGPAATPGQPELAPRPRPVP